MLYTFVFDGFGEFMACGSMLLFCRVVLDVVEAEGFIAELVLFGLELIEFVTCLIQCQLRPVREFVHCLEL